MKFIPLLLLVCACKAPAHNIPAKEPDISYISSVDSLISNVEKSQSRLLLIFEVVQKRDSFLIKKYQNEVLYYKSGDDKYRRRCNRLIDSIHKYVHVMDSVSKTMK
jgi:hypothetical protein